MNFFFSVGVIASWNGVKNVNPEIAKSFTTNAIPFKRVISELNNKLGIKTE